MRRGWLVALVVGSFVVALALAGAVAETTKSGEVPDSFIIETKEMKPKDLKPGVGFTHKKHSVDYQIACTECHHDFKDGQNVWKEGDPVQKCIACHDMEKKQGNADKYKNAMHKNCQECHKKVAKEGKTAGPTTKCEDCHTGKLPQ